MQVLKKLTRGLASVAFTLLILVTATVAALVMTFNSPKKIEKSLSDSGVYSTFVSGALQEAQKSSAKESSTGNNDIPIDNPAIVAAANKAFTPQLLQTTTEDVLNGTYDWLAGRVKTPSFTIDFVAAKQTFAQAVGDAAEKQLASLPVCTTAQAIAQGSDIDPFKATCRPAGLDVATQKNKVVNDLANSKDFLGTPKLTPQNLPKDKNGKTIFDSLAEAPKIYKWVNVSPWLLIGLTVLAGGITWLLYDDKRRGLRHVAIVLTVIGGLLIVTNIGTRLAFRHLEQSGVVGRGITTFTNGASDSPVTNPPAFSLTATKIIDSLVHSFEQVVLWFGIAYVVIGGGTLLALHFIKPKTKSTTSKDDKEQPVPPIDDSPNNESKPAPKPKEKPTPKPKTVQG